MKHLICDISDENDDEQHLLVIEMTKENLDVIVRRSDFVEKLRGEDAGVLSVQYFCDYVDIYEYSSGFVDLLEDGDAKLFKSQDWILTDSEVFRQCDQGRIGEAYLHVRATGSVYWTVVPKHWNASLETRGINVKRDLVPHVE